jgi:hypothetical protein
MSSKCQNSHMGNWEACCISDNWVLLPVTESSPTVNYCIYMVILTPLWSCKLNPKCRSIWQIADAGQIWVVRIFYELGGISVTGMLARGSRDPTAASHADWRPRSWPDPGPTGPCPRIGCCVHNVWMYAIFKTIIINVLKTLQLLTSWDQSERIEA